MDSKEDDKQKEDPIKKLEEEFHDFQEQWNKQWNEFMANDMKHLTDNVSILIGRSVALENSIPAIEKSIQVIDNNILELLKRGQ